MTIIIMMKINQVSVNCPPIMVMIEHGYSKKMIIKDKLLIKRLKRTKIMIKNNKRKVN